MEDLSQLEEVFANHMKYANNQRKYQRQHGQQYQQQQMQQYQQQQQQQQQQIQSSKADQRFMCGECGKAYKWMDNLRRHQRLECGKLPSYRCRLCPKMFYRRYELTNHENTKHLVE